MSSAPDESVARLGDRDTEPVVNIQRGADSVIDVDALSKMLEALGLITEEAETVPLRPNLAFTDVKFTEGVGNHRLFGGLPWHPILGGLTVEKLKRVQLITDLCTVKRVLIELANWASVVEQDLNASKYDPEESYDEG